MRQWKDLSAMLTEFAGLLQKLLTKIATKFFDVVTISTKLLFVFNISITTRSWLMVSIYQYLKDSNPTEEKDHTFWEKIPKKFIANIKHFFQILMSVLLRDMIVTRRVSIRSVLTIACVEMDTTFSKMGKLA